MRQPHPELNFGRGRGRRTTARGLLKAMDLLGLTREEQRDICARASETCPFCGAQGSHLEKCDRPDALR